MLLDLSERVEELGLRLGLGRRQPVLQAALRADLAAVGDLAAHDARQAGHGLHGLLDAQPALPGAGVGDAGRDLGRPHDPRHRHGQPRGGRAARVRGARAGLRQARGRSSRRGSRSCAQLWTEGRVRLPRQLLRLRRRLVLLGHRDGAADADPARRRRSGSSPTRGCVGDAAAGRHGARACRPPAAGSSATATAG